MVALVSSFEEFGTGYHVNHPQVEMQKRWYRWYACDYSELLPPRTVNNGLSLIDDDDLIKEPLFKTASDFISNSFMSDMPTPEVLDPDGEGAAWLKANARMLDRQLLRAVKYWSIIGQGVLTGEPGRIRAHDPTVYYRVGEPDDDDATVGHILAYPWREKTFEELQQPTNILPDNRITITKVDAEGVATVQTFYYSEARIIGEPYNAVAESPITAVCTFGLNDGWYEDAKSVAARIIISISLINMDINRWRNAPVYVPASIANDIKNSIAVQSGSTRLGTDVSLSEVTEYVKTRVRPVIAINEKDALAIGEAQMAPDLSHAFMEIDRFEETFGKIANLTPDAFGYRAPNTSGVAMERAEDAAAARIQRGRNDVVECLPRLIKAAGFPADEDVSFNWTGNPFQNKSAQLDDLLRLHGAGIVEAPYVRRNYNIELQEGDVESTPAETEPDQGADDTDGMVT